MVIVGIDAQTPRHAAAAIDNHGRMLGTFDLGAAAEELRRLLGWVDIAAHGTAPATDEPSPRRGDEADAVAIARLALRKPDCRSSVRPARRRPRAARRRR